MRELKLIALKDTLMTKRIPILGRTRKGIAAPVLEKGGEGNMENREIIEIIKKVPAKRLLIIELANSVPIKHGDFDVDYLREIQPQVNLAVAEAKAYGAHTIQAVDAIMRLPGRTYDLQPLIQEDLEAGLQF